MWSRRPALPRARSGKKAEVRGCGDIMSEKVARTHVATKLSGAEEDMAVYISPVKLDASASPSGQLESIFTKLQGKADLAGGAAG